jgi:hypothetical protein
LPIRAAEGRFDALFGENTYRPLESPDVASVDALLTGIIGVRRRTSALALTLYLAGFATASDESVRLVTHNSLPVGCYTNWAAGPLIVDPEYGTAIKDIDVSGSTAPVTWRPGFTARRVGSEVEVLDPDGKAVAITGGSYRIAGGYVHDEFWACDFVTAQ